VLVLDEPTAHLDPDTARRLMTDVLDAAGSRAVLLVTHREEGLDRMDEITSLGAAGHTPGGRSSTR
jgi:ABC-type transport system involved in cytochrome bd biosynthesis fused ATPase/permease subunit